MQQLIEDRRGPSNVHVKALIAVDVLANQARASGLDAREICAQTVRQLEREESELGKTIEKACNILDQFSSINDVVLDQLLPTNPINFISRPKREPFLLPNPFEDKLSVWLAVATKGDWIETDEEFNPDIDIAPYRNAARKIISTALEIGIVKLEGLATIACFFEKRIVVEVVKTLRRWHFEGHPRAIKAKTVRGYLEKLAIFLDANGESSKHLRKILAESKWLKPENPREGKMPQRTRSFCRRIVRDMQARIRFLSLQIHIRKIAMGHLKSIIQEPHRATFHKECARRFGTLAAFAALMTDVVPARIGCIPPATFRGQAPWLELGRKRADNGYLTIPAGHVKNSVGISAQIKATSQFRGLDTLRWYEAAIRPLFPHHETSNFFFPAIVKKRKSLSYHTFMSWWSAEIAEAGFPGMTPHMFRHGQVSILISNNPGDWATVAARIGDRETTVREYYAWIDEERLILKGQQRLAEAFYHAA